jgi:hypothetical protein
VRGRGPWQTKEKATSVPLKPKGTPPRHPKSTAVSGKIYRFIVIFFKGGADWIWGDFMYLRFVVSEIDPISRVSLGVFQAAA